ncbi:peptide ABC transporter substrate-binding protein [Fluviispira multicolorata]|uniref:Peptide ABC transporter substrate-binding protein n=1 Tax=Fluviispira multicolorata TaxID=2654512 RepID=A0A833JGR6_9BACT|nr:peptide ABC transporter substrate-binding protein [Fluviispira multicolorata]KAB8032191.1 peptide ABC transporter substrate-binding protein [Fluviispira multicolorata]
MNRYLKICAISLTFSHAAFAAIPKDSQAAKIQELNIGNSDDPTSLDPHVCHESACAVIIEQMFEGLVNTNYKGDIVSAQAERWDISADKKKYTFYLRKNLKWSDGTNITAYDYIYGFQRLVDPKIASENVSLIENIVNAKEINLGKMPLNSLGMKALNDHTLEINLIRPTPYFLDAISVSSVAPVQKKNIEKYGKSSFIQQNNFVSNGPFVLAQRKVGDKIVLVPNNNYWNKDNIYLSKVNFYSIKELTTEFRMYESGQLHVTSKTPGDQFKEIKSKYPTQFKTESSLATYYYIYNLRNPKLKNRNLRQALNIAIDRIAITKSILGSGELPSYDFIPYGMKSYTQNKAFWQDWPREKQLNEAKKLYKEAGYSNENPLKIQILYNTSEGHRKLASAIASMWKQALGVQVEMVNEEWKSMLDKRGTGQFEVLRLGNIAVMNDPYDFFSQFRSFDINNDSKFNNVEYDKLVQLSNNELDPEKRKILLEKAGKIIIEEVPLSPIYNYVKNYLVRDDVVGFKKNAMDKYSLVGVYLKDKGKKIN